MSPPDLLAALAHHVGLCNLVVARRGDRIDQVAQARPEALLGARDLVQNLCR